MEKRNKEGQCRIEESNEEEEPKDQSFIDEIKIYFRNYCNHTGIHGFQYFGKHRTLIEKIWWVLVFLLTISMCSYCIFLIYEKWSNSPIIVSLATKETPIYQIPFPAVTICPTIKYSKKCFNRDDEFDKNIKKLEGYTQLLCKYHIDYEDVDPSMDEYYTNSLYETLLECSPFTQEDITVRFMNEKNLTFKDVFSPIITVDGLCFAFNMLDKKEIFSDEVVPYFELDESVQKSTWMPQVGYPEDAVLEAYPRRALFSGGINSLEITIPHLERDVDNSCNRAEQGYKVLLHIPSRIARPTMEYIMVPFNKSTTITVIPEVMSTSTRVKKYKPELRNCYFPEEKYLKFYKVYTKNSCEIECVANHTLIYCKCVAFWMPRYDSTPICGPSKASCVSKARERYDLSNLKDKLTEERSKRRLAKLRQEKYTKILSDEEEQKKIADEIRLLENEIDSVKSKCNCFPICSDITYTGTASSLDFKWDERIGSNWRDTSPNDVIEGQTHINIFIKTNEIFTRERNELYGFTDFVSNFGGLLGLFSGFSILSFMEIVYYLSIRIIGNCKKFGRWYGKEE